MSKFEKVGETFAVGWVGELAHVDVERCGRHVGVGVGHHEALHAVVERKVAVLAVVERGHADGAVRGRDGG